MREIPSAKKTVKGMLTTVHCLAWVLLLSVKFGPHNLISYYQAFGVIVTTGSWIGIFYLFYYVKHLMENMDNYSNGK